MKLPPLLVLALALGAAPAWAAFEFKKPREGQLSAPTRMIVKLRLDASLDRDTLEVRLDGTPVDPASLRVKRRQAKLVFEGLSEGSHELVATAAPAAGGALLEARRRFEIASLGGAKGCEVLIDAECLLPYPSSHFLKRARTPTGWRLNLPESGIPLVFDQGADAAPYRALDGFSPGVHPLLFFPGGVDLAASGAPVLDPTTRTFDARSLDADSPTLLIDAETGERILHFVELDARIGISEDPTRQVMFLRPGRTLEPARRYIVAVRALVDPVGDPVPPGPAFAALRDGSHTTIRAVKKRRRDLEDVFAALADAGVPRGDLILAFDFVTQSDETLTKRLLAMRDEAYDWLDDEIASGRPLFSVDAIEELDCTEGGLWRDVQGTFRVPLFLTRNPLIENRETSFVLTSKKGRPKFKEIMDARFSMLVPCSARDGELVRPLLHAHGGGGDYRTARAVHDAWNGTAATNPTPGVPDRDLAMVAPHYLIGGTDNHGFGQLDFEGGADSFLFKLFFEAGAAPSLSARIHQGQINLLVLGRLMKRGLFNVEPAFQTPAGAGVFPGPAEELYVWGVSFGGFSGIIHGAISPDVDRVAPAVAVVNFSNQAQRDTVFDAFDVVLPIALGPDAMSHAITIAIAHDLWAQADPIAFIRHLTANPLPGSTVKKVLLQIGWLDQKSPNIFSDVAARDLGLASLAGSFRTGLVGIPDETGPLDSAYVSFAPAIDADDPTHAPYVPPLENRTADASPCDPHILTWLTPAYLEQVGEFFRPDGGVVNTCVGTCDGQEPEEIEYGNAERCDPTLEGG